MLCAFVQEGGRPRPLGLGRLGAGVAKAVRQAAAETEGKAGRVSVVHTLGTLRAERILLAGVGRDASSPDAFRLASGRAAQRAREAGVPEFSVIVPGGPRPGAEGRAAQVVEGARMSLFSFDRYKREKAKADPELVLLAPRSAAVRRAVSDAERIADAVVFTKGIANLPPNDCSPATLAGIARAVAGGGGGRRGGKPRLKCTVMSKPQLKKLGFGGITAVGGGSANEPRLIVLEYGGGRRGERPVALVGKAVTFDTGGISLKPGDKMDEMKFDKCGGCTVLGIMKAVAELGVRRNVVGLVPSVENMPGGESYRPGDIVRLYSGKTAEILNTDAEGRLILADAMAYAEKRYSPEAIIDFATLTGACIVALGTNVAGMVTNDDGLGGAFMRSSRNTAEEIWQLPLRDHHMEMIRSDVADVKNMGIGRAAGTITAAAFLREAIGDTPWAHFDIAGVAWTQAATKEKPYNPKGATGFGVRLVLDYLSGGGRGGRGQ